MNNSQLLKVAIAQINTHVGAIESNTEKIIEHANRAAANWSADLVVFPELSLCSYPPEDLLYRDGLYRRVNAALQSICEKVSAITVVVGYPKKSERGLYNMAGVIQDGRQRGQV